MNTTHKDMIQDEFQKLKHSQRLLNIPFYLFLGFLLISRFIFPDILNDDIFINGIYGIPGKAIKYGFPAVFVPYVLFLRLRWKCPNCKTNFGKVSNPSFCQACGIQLIEYDN